MYRGIKNLLLADSRLKWVLLGGLLIQLISSVTAIGFSSFDQHFSIIEFSSYQLHNDHAANYAVEFVEKIRPTLQVYLFSGYYKICTALGINDPYSQLTILRIIVGLIMFIAFNLIAIYYFKNSRPGILFWVLVIINFSWLFPHIRTLYNSEMMSGLFFFSTLAYLDYKLKNRPAWLYLFIIGFLFSLAFYFRFQIGFCITGVGIWLLLKKEYKNIFYILAGFLLGFIINTFLDSAFYHETLFTPYNYFVHNIIKDKASEYGTSSFLKYIGLLVAVLSSPPFSIILFYYLVRSVFKNFKNPVYLSVLLFIIAHCLVPHKEERFLFPVFFALPLMVGWSLPMFYDYVEKCNKGVRVFVRILIAFTILLNTTLLLLFTFIPYAQTVYFGKKIKETFGNNSAVIYCAYRTPFETQSGIPMKFYSNSVKGISFIKIPKKDTLSKYLESAQFFATTFNETKKYHSQINSLGFKPIAYSSKFLWRLNVFLESKKKPTVNDAWVLFEKE